MSGPSRHSTVSGENGQQPMSSRTLRLFTVSSDAGGDVGTETGAAAAATSKNPRWLVNHEKEAKGEAIRDKIVCLLREIEAEEGRERPALKKTWLHEKKMELRRISFKQPEEIIACESYVRRVRRKLRDAQRRWREKHGGDVSADDGDPSDGGDSGGESEAGPDSTAAAKGVRRRWTVSGAAGAVKKAGDKSDSEDEAPNNDGVFNLSPTGRMAKPNPRVKSPKVTERHQQTDKWRKPLEKVNKVVRFPLESGYKLGRFIRSRREKSKGEAESADSANWGDRVDSGPSSAVDDSRQRRRGQQSPPSSASNRSEGANEFVIDESDGSGGIRRKSSRKSSSSSGSSSSSSIADIPVLQESVGKKLLDRLAIRRPTARGGDDRKSDTNSNGDGDSATGEKKKKKKKEDKKPKEKEKKAKKQNSDDADYHGDEAKKKQKNADKKQKNGVAMNQASAAAVRGSVSEPVQFVELEDDAD